MKPGRRPKPTKVKILEGNPGKRPLNTNEPVPPEGRPSCPQWLNKEAKKEWRRVARDLHEMGLLSKVDRTALAGYCEAYSRYLWAVEKCKDGYTYEFYNHQFQTKREKMPEEQILRDALNQVKQFCSEFGLTPSSRGRMQVPGQKETEDPMESILKRCSTN